MDGSGGPGNDSGLPGGGSGGTGGGFGVGGGELIRSAGEGGATSWLEGNKRSSFIIFPAAFRTGPGPPGASPGCPGAAPEPLLGGPYLVLVGLKEVIKTSF